ncbi:hypothetical protein ACOSP7_007049 [Xanthoceras sorbifolium]
MENPLVALSSGYMETVPQLGQQDLVVLLVGLLGLVTEEKSSAENLKEEWERNYEQCPGPKNLAGTVSIIIRHPSKPSPKLKLVARKGKLEIDQEELWLLEESWKDGGCRKGRTSEDCAGKYYSIFQGGKDSRRQKGCCGGKRLQPNRSYSKLVITNCGLMD